MGVSSGHDGSAGHSREILSAAGHSKRIYAWPIVALVLIGSAWLFFRVSTAPATTQVRHRSETAQLQVDDLWRRIDRARAAAVHTPSMKDYADHMEEELVRSTGPRRSALAASPTKRRWRRAVVAVNVLIIGIVAAWLCLFDRRGRLAVTPSEIRILPDRVAEEKSLDRSRVALSIRPRPWLLRVLGLGASDLLVRTQEGEEFVIPNVFRAQSFLKRVNEAPIVN